MTSFFNEQKANAVLNLALKLMSPGELCACLEKQNSPSWQEPAGRKPPVGETCSDLQVGHGPCLPLSPKPEFSLAGKPAGRNQ